MAMGPDNSSRSIFWANDFPPVTSGIATFFVNICRHLPANSVEVIAPQMEETAEVDEALPYPVRRLKLPVGESGSAKLFKTFLTFWYALIESLLRRPARHHCGQVLSSGIAGLLCKKLLGVPYIVYVYGSETVRLGSSGLARRLMHAVMNNSDRVIANSQVTAEEFIAFGTDADHIQVIYPGVDATRFNLDLPDQIMIERYGLQGKKVLLTVARLDERKGHDTVIRALGMLAQEEPNLIYLVPSIGREEERLRQLVQELKLEDRVQFLGLIPNEDLPKLYNVCDIYIMPNRVTTESALAGDIEGFGIAFVEAGACGKPVIACRSGGAVEAVLDDETGLLVEPGSDEAVADAIRRLLHDSDLTTRLGAAGRNRVETTFDWPILSAQLERWV
jgi:phosphatidylinositol alpha-1,6-mannosyltransferase